MCVLRDIVLVVRLSARSVNQTMGCRGRCLVRFDSGTSSSTGQISNTRDRVLSIEFHARSSNAGAVYFGRSDVTATNGRELLAGENAILDFSDGNSNPSRSAGSTLFSEFYVVIGGGGDKVDWLVILF